MKVNLLIPGAGRSGTTSLCKILEEHPQVCFSGIKEIHFFSLTDLHQRGDSYYHSFFGHYNNEPVKASADTYLFIDHDAIQRVYDYNPDMKFIIMLRDPVSRAYSSYNYAVNYGYESPKISFSQAITEEPARIKQESIITQNNLGHIETGRYYKHITQWMNTFPEENFLLFKTSDLNENFGALWKRVCNFLDIEFIQPTQHEALNKNAIPANKKLEQFLLNRDLPLRKLIRNLTPKFIKSLLIGSGIVQKMHDINRTEAKYKKINSQEKELAFSLLKDDIEKLKKQFHIEF
jgi:hypothetical protein